MTDQPFEYMRSEDGLCEWFFAHSDQNVTTGVLVMQPGAFLEPHVRDDACENDVQISGQCVMTIYSNSETVAQEIVLRAGSQLRLQKGQLHAHANTSNDVSITQFKHDGDMTEIMKATRASLQHLELKDVSHG